MNLIYHIFLYCYSPVTHEFYKIGNAMPRVTTLFRWNSTEICKFELTSHVDLALLYNGFRFSADSFQDNWIVCFCVNLMFYSNLTTPNCCTFDPYCLNGSDALILKISSLSLIDIGIPTHCQCSLLPRDSLTEANSCSLLQRAPISSYCFQPPCY